jgi:hypothetical protein
MNDFESKEQNRPEYQGTLQRSPITGKVEKFYPTLLKVLKKSISASAIGTMVLQSLPICHSILN